MEHTKSSRLQHTRVYVSASSNDYDLMTMRFPGCWCFSLKEETIISTFSAKGGGKKLPRLLGFL